MLRTDIRVVLAASRRLLLGLFVSLGIGVLVYAATKKALSPGGPMLFWLLTEPLCVVAGLWFTRRFVKPGAVTIIAMTMMVIMVTAWDPLAFALNQRGYLPLPGFMAYRYGGAIGHGISYALLSLPIYLAFIALRMRLDAEMPHAEDVRTELWKTGLVLFSVAILVTGALWLVLSYEDGGSIPSTEADPQQDASDRAQAAWDELEERLGGPLPPLSAETPESSDAAEKDGDPSPPDGGD